MVKSTLLAATALAIASLSNPTFAACDSGCLAEKALAGDGGAALQLAQDSLYKSHNRMVYWYRVAAENGNTTGQWNYAMWLVADSKTRADCVRALYWFKQAHSKGHPLAAETVEVLSRSLAKSDGYLKGCQHAL